MADKTARHTMNRSGPMAPAFCIGTEADARDHGMVGADCGRTLEAVAPFGGIWPSGSGHDGSKQCSKQCVDIKYRRVDIDHAHAGRRTSRARTFHEAES